MITGAQFPPLTPLTVDTQSVLFVFLVLVVLPVGAVRSRSTIAKGARRRTRGHSRPPRRSDVLTRALIVQLLLFTMSFVVARHERMDLWSWTGLRPVNVGIAIGALTLLLVLGALSWQLRTPEERRTLWMRHLLPRTSAQWALWLVLSLAAGVAEETAYRGVLVVLLASVTASFVTAVLLSAAAFALVHYPQGAKSMGWVFAIGLVMQAVVAGTGMLYVAMGVHAVYDVTAAIRAAGKFREDGEDPFVAISP
ncbi:MAG TPA: CPBP family intramembrane glutamic endopeptidase [Gemmatimonadaceae bacterium]|nr:CPBP family intramembrane glutamic endopeptidase [Gemmatimonadaceae bacterium]